MRLLHIYKSNAIKINLRVLTTFCPRQYTCIYSVMCASLIQYEVIRRRHCLPFPASDARIRTYGRTLCLYSFPMIYLPRRRRRQRCVCVRQQIDASRRNAPRLLRNQSRTRSRVCLIIGLPFRPTRNLNQPHLRVYLHRIISICNKCYYIYATCMVCFFGARVQDNRPNWFCHTIRARVYDVPLKSTL